MSGNVKKGTNGRWGKGNKGKYRKGEKDQGKPYFLAHRSPALPALLLSLDPIMFMHFSTVAPTTNIQASSLIVYKIIVLRINVMLPKQIDSSMVFLQFYC